ncbi:MAG: class I SAM-dependent methyltransferase [Deltaproteobacteria bacterium]|nr:class I SAM-dependent methyltransferase [Deltaproteobacteria bacterium]
MKSSSATAQFGAAHRAYHLMSTDSVILEDTAADWLLGPPLSTVLHIAPLRWLFWRPLFKKVRLMSAFVVIRSRYTEDVLGQSIQDGCRQYVVLGAGLDSWALRHRDSIVTVFELDHPATQQWKKLRIESRMGSLPPQLTLIPIDFEHESITDLLPRHGFDSQSKAFVSWLGTVYYLTRGAIRDAFASLANSCAPGSRIVFDYFLPKSMMLPTDQQLFGVLDKGGTRRGEPIVTLLDANEIEEVLCSTGFRIVEDLSAADIRQRYLSQRSDGLDVPGFVHLCCAERQKAG